MLLGLEVLSLHRTPAEALPLVDELRARRGARLRIDWTDGEIAAGERPPLPHALVKRPRSRTCKRETSEPHTRGGKAEIDVQLCPRIRKPSTWKARESELEGDIRGSKPRKACRLSFLEGGRFLSPNPLVNLSRRKKRVPASSRTPFLPIPLRHTPPAQKPPLFLSVLFGPLPILPLPRPQATRTTKGHQNSVPTAETIEG